MKFKMEKHNYHTFELFQDKDFPEQMYADQFYEDHKILPFGYLIFYTEKDQNANKKKVKNILIKFEKSSLYDKELTEEEIQKLEQINRTFKPFELFSNALWKKIGISSSYEKFPAEKYITDLKSRKEFFWPYLYDFNNDIFENIWNEYCLIEGRISIDKDSFCLWLYRLNSIIFDLYEFPYLNEDNYNWQWRYLFIRELIKDEHSNEFEYYNKDNWNKILKERFTRKMATDTRIMDTKDLLNEFFMRIKPINALERFLISFYESFGNELCEDKLLIKCNFCGEYIKYKKGKKYCSLLADEKDCAKKARNRRYYERRGKKRLAKYRKNTRELRDFYRSRGIKK